MGTVDGPTGSKGLTGLTASGRSSKYDPLRAHITVQWEPAVTLTFAPIESALGLKLPAWARKYRPCWANGKNGRHVDARSWLNAARRSTDVDPNACTVDSHPIVALKLHTYGTAPGGWDTARS